MITVITSAATHNLITLSQLKMELGITSTDDDAWLTQAIEQNSKAIESYCDRVFAEETVDETVPGEGTPFLILSRTPVSAITSIKYGKPGAQDTVDASSYAIHSDRAGMVANLNGVWNDTSSPVIYSLGHASGGFNLNLYTVRYKAGYSIIPADVQRACIEMCKVTYSRRNDDPSLASIDVPDVIRKSWRDASAQAAVGVPDTVYALLQPYRSVV